MRIFILVLANVLIFAIIRWLFSSKKLTDEQEKEEQDKARNHQYSIGYPLKMKIIMAILMILFGAAFFYNLGNNFHWWSINSHLWVTILFGVFFALTLYCFVGTCVWRIDVQGDEIYFRNSFGIKRRYKFSEIDDLKVEQTKTTFYSKGRKLFTIDLGVNSEYFEAEVSEHVKNKKCRDNNSRWGCSKLY